MNGLNQPDRVAGFPCPVCGIFIPTTINDLLYASSLSCPSCRLQLDIDRNDSKKALEVLSQVDEAQKKVKAASTYNG